MYKKCYFSKNQIQKISFDHECKIEAWHQLRSLNLADNELEELPNEISQGVPKLQLDLPLAQDAI